MRKFPSLLYKTRYFLSQFSEVEDVRKDGIRNLRHKGVNERLSAHGPNACNLAQLSINTRFIAQNDRNG